MAFFDIFKKKQDTPPTGEQAQKQQEELSAGLEKTKTGLFSKLARAVAGRSTIDAGVLDDLEEVLISSDVGVETTVKIIRRIEGKNRKQLKSRKFAFLQTLTPMILIPK